MKNAEMALGRRREEMTATDLKTWYETSERRGKSRKIEEKEQRLIEIYLRIKNSSDMNKKIQF